MRVWMLAVLWLGVWACPWVALAQPNEAKTPAKGRPRGVSVVFEPVKDSPLLRVVVSGKRGPFARVSASLTWNDEDGSKPLLVPLALETAPDEPTWRASFLAAPEVLPSFKVSVAVVEEPPGGLTLHYGFSFRPADWQAPPPATAPAGPGPTTTPVAPDVR